MWSDKNNHVVEPEKRENGPMERDTGAVSTKDKMCSDNNPSAKEATGSGLIGNVTGVNTPESCTSIPQILSFNHSQGSQEETNTKKNRKFSFYHKYGHSKNN